jgi:hypothetical protein
MSWEALAEAPTPEDCHAASSVNTGVISFLLHGIDLDAAQRPMDESLAEALLPLRIKLDILIGMVGRLTYRGITLPPTRDIELGMGRMAWHSPGPLDVGKWLRIKLYFDPNFLEPLVIYARVTSALPDEATGGCGVQAEPVETPPETEEAFTRLTFLAQRRQLAQRAAQAQGAFR